mmetsp:Transcript_13549/g.26994  ORF Transcript_13549/g.26994 Transcript_13549/m.26994 type:complete len:95 (+) Transcript_13549:751-1035(+)
MECDLRVPSSNINAKPSIRGSVTSDSFVTTEEVEESKVVLLVNKLTLSREIILGENAQEKLHIWDSSNVIDMEMIWRDMAFKFCNYVLFQLSML